ncbi:MAG: hypothetical protein MUF42_07665 [Cytophagaceae bacterium]|nr:hypothetical protein [Cytophagaceae bacterium]
MKHVIHSFSILKEVIFSEIPAHRQKARAFHSIGLRRWNILAGIDELRKRQVFTCPRKLWKPTSLPTFKPRFKESFYHSFHLLS